MGLKIDPLGVAFVAAIAAAVAIPLHTLAHIPTWSSLTLGTIVAFTFIVGIASAFVLAERLHDKLRDRRRKRRFSSARRR